MKEKLIDKEKIRKIHPIFKGRLGNLLLKMLFSVGGLNKVNGVYDASKQYSGLPFVSDMLDKLEIKREIDNHEILDQFEGKPFITVSNHPYGHIDGIIVIDTVAKKRPDFKVMVNWILGQIDTMDDFFIGVNPYSGDKMSNVKSSVGGVKECLAHIKDGHPLGLFPAGGVSSNYLTKTEDRDWQPSVLRLIKKCRVPIIPLYISGNNSLFYRFLGVVNWRIRTVRLLHEVTNKKGKTIYVRFGKPIMPEEQDTFTEIEEFGEFLKKQTYALKKK